MKPVIAKQTFQYNGKFYIAKKEIGDKLPLDILNKLNEKGFIEPLSIEDMLEYENELGKPKKDKEVK